MKKLLALLMATVISMATMCVTAMADEKVKLIINGSEVDFSGDQEPVIQNGRTLVPFRAAFEKMGAEVNWYDDIRHCEATYGGMTVGISIGDTKVVLGDGAELESDVPAQIINGRTMVPLRILSESIGAEVNWDSATRTITVDAPDIVGEAPDSVQYDTNSAVATGKINVSYQYPVITDIYTGVSILNKNIVSDISEVATDVATTAKTEKKEISISYEVQNNSGGVFSIIYYIGDEMVYYNHYGIINGARISDEEYALITGVDTEENKADDEKDNSEINNVTNEKTEKNEVFSIDKYEISKNASDGYACINATVQYPKFLIDKDFVPSLNTQLENSAKNAADSFVASYFEDARKIYENPPEHLFEVPYSFFGNCEVEVTDENIAVIKTEFHETKYNEDSTNTDIIKINLNNGEIVE